MSPETSSSILSGNEYTYIRIHMKNFFLTRRLISLISIIFYIEILNPYKVQGYKWAKLIGCICNRDWLLIPPALMWLERSKSPLTAIADTEQIYTTLVRSIQTWTLRQHLRRKETNSSRKKRNATNSIRGSGGSFETINLGSTKKRIW